MTNSDTRGKEKVGGYACVTEPLTQLLTASRKLPRSAFYVIGGRKQHSHKMPPIHKYLAVAMYNTWKGTGENAAAHIFSDERS
ncbi:hypothetical protein KIN20_034014 [Parelaphostrongylus tenuis]|uniref:Uncharacterized protein n=1 Tax=Parelaphostrongylus tenuis TaxID=148309 RepID=A0AAD5R9Q0_PARTN|nr:hypothetical protein KIN20_034014 [Parelaphostrongylus tenuis]